ncbi:GNAT family N-acetyltransferase [Schaalia sp. 19OD2882]|nr:GNAT family N-acetyltransferase [Schaalia sp. 19OD2882]
MPLAVRANAPADVPFPVSAHGVEWSELTVEHLHPLANLVARIEARDNPPFRTSPDEVFEMLSSGTQWRGVAGFATRGMANGRMVAFAQVELRFPGHVECVCQGGVDPAFRRVGLGASLVAWQEMAARQMLAGIPGNGPAQIVAQVETGQEDHEEHLKARGFRWARTYYELRADLRVLPQMPDLGRWLEVEPWGPQWEEPTRHLANRISEQEWGRRPITAEQWSMGRTAFVPEWSFVAVDKKGDRPRVAGFLMASRYVQDWAALGWREGYIDQMAVDQDYRNAHVVDALVVSSMHAQAADGMDRTGAGLGSANHSGALAVYDYLGFRTVGQSRLYAIEI